MRIRTDFFIKRRGSFLDYFDKCNKGEKKYQCTKKKILTLDNGASLFDILKDQCPFAISDYTFFGLTEDIITLWDVPLMKPPLLFGVEQYIVIHLLRKNGLSLHCKHAFDVNPKTIKLSYLSNINNFIFLPREIFPIICFEKRLKITGFKRRITFYDWLKLYKKYYDNKLKIPFFPLYIKIRNRSFYLLKKYFAHFINMFIFKKQYRKKVRRFIIEC